MHYCGMVAADFNLAEDMPIENKLTEASIEKQSSLYSVLFSALMVLWIFTLFVLADLRQRYNRSQKKLAKALKMASTKTNLGSSKSNLQSASESSKSALSEMKVGSLDVLRPLAGLKWNAVIPEMPSRDEEHGGGF